LLPVVDKESLRREILDDYGRKVVIKAGRMIVTKFRERCNKSAPTDFSKFWQLPEQEV
jgi:hypothetical protein